MKNPDYTSNKAYKRCRLRMLVDQGSITQQKANQLWRDYLRMFK